MIQRYDAKQKLSPSLGPLSIGSAPPPPSPRLMKKAEPVQVQGISQLATEPIEWPWRYRSQAPSRVRARLA